MAVSDAAPSPSPPVGAPAGASAGTDAGADASVGMGTGAGTGTTGEAGPSVGAAVVGPLCLVLLAGLAMPPHGGWLLPLALVLAMAVVGHRRLRSMRGVRLALDRGQGGPLARVALLGAALLSVAVLLTVLSRAIGALWVEIPATLWGAAAALGGAVIWAAVGTRLPARIRPLGLVALALVIPAAGVMGTRYEQAGPDARGLAHSGPILGIHPFQTTAILVDGHGPFDLPINDYVEPGGERGYDPVALADAIDRALVSVANRVYPHGPQRVRRALVDAEVEAVQTPAVWERLDRAPTESTQPRLVVRSGSFGRDSRVEFVCPGRRIDPRGPQGESVMNKMCPDKYASEASAGLGVTGRWSGYSERRGNDRLGLFRLWGWTRSDDGPGRRVLERETRIWAWLLLLGVAVLVLARGSKRPGPVASVGEGVRALGGALGVLGVAALVVLSLSAGGEPAVGMLPAGPSWWSWPPLSAWAPALALGSVVLFAFEGTATTGPATGGRGVVVPAVLVGVATVALAAHLPALRWALPMDPTEGARLTALVRGVAETLGEPWGLSIFEVEGLVASTLVAILLGGAVATGRAGMAALERLAPPHLRRGARAGAWVAMLALAAALVISRKTAGAAALMPGVVGLTLVLGSGVLRMGGASSWALPRALPRPSPWLGRLVHLGWATLGAALVWASVDPLPAHAFVTACTAVGLVAVVAVGLAGMATPTVSPDEPDPLERDGAGRL